MLTRRPTRPILLDDALKTLTGATDVLSTADAKDYLNVTHTDDDALIGAMINTAKDFFTRSTGHRLDDEIRTAVYDKTADVFDLPAFPVRSISAVRTLDEDSSESMTASDFYLRGNAPVRVHMLDTKTWNTPADGVEIDYVCGYDSVGDVPDGIAEVLKKMVSDLYEFRSSVTVNAGEVPRKLPMEWSMLVSPYRLFKI